MPTLYNNFYHGSGLDQVFGVNIDKHCNFTRKKVPQIVMKCLTRIKKSSVALTNEQKLACWTAEVPLADIHVLRNKINQGGKITQKLLRLFDMATIVGVLRLYFLELPGSLLNGEEYETVKIIYSSVSDDASDAKNDARISSIRNLLGLLSSARFYTLYEVVKHISGLIKETSADESFTSFVAHRWGPVFLRPLEETAVTLHDKHPQRMMRDMLKMTHQIFEPIRMQREDGNLSRSTTRVSVGPRPRKDGPRVSRDLKGNYIHMNGNGHVDLAQAKPAVPVIALEGKPTGVPAAQDGGSGVGVGTPAGAGSAPGGAKLQRRFGPNGGRFNLTRGVSAPEMFSEVPAKKKPAPNGANGAEGSAADGSNQEGDAVPGLLNTKGLLPTAGGSRSPLRRSIIASTTADDIAETAEEKVNEDSEAKTDTQVQEEQKTNIEPEPTKAEEQASAEGPADWKAVSGAEFEATGRKLERRRKNRQSALTNSGGAGPDSSLNLGELSAESVLQALREEDNK
ncbi:hypothetical protein BGX20_003328 [Mortierella sp. AD010]|nr:hypothetical protein BGX20_003328 [Mortierella sp. AD010]